MVETILDRLRGAWSFEREIDNGVTVLGRAKLAPAGDGHLHYHEDGRMQLPGGGELASYADYLFTQQGGRLSLLFREEPPRLFQSFDLQARHGTLEAKSIHDCPPDLYRSRIAFQSDGTWSLQHAVTGPRKAYVSVTRYIRP